MQIWSINYRKQRVYCFRAYCIKSLSSPAVFTSNVQFVRLAAGRRSLIKCVFIQKSSCFHAVITFKTLTFHKVHCSIFIFIRQKRQHSMKRK